DQDERHQCEEGRRAPGSERCAGGRWPDVHAFPVYGPVGHGTKIRRHGDERRKPRVCRGKGARSGASPACPRRRWTLRYVPSHRTIRRNASACSTPACLPSRTAQLRKRSSTHSPLPTCERCALSDAHFVARVSPMSIHASGGTAPLIQTSFTLCGSSPSVNSSGKIARVSDDGKTASRAALATAR